VGSGLGARLAPTPIERDGERVGTTVAFEGERTDRLFPMDGRVDRIAVCRGFEQPHARCVSPCSFPRKNATNSIGSRQNAVSTDPHTSACACSPRGFRCPWPGALLKRATSIRTAEAAELPSHSAKRSASSWRPRHCFRPGNLSAPDRVCWPECDPPHESNSGHRDFLVMSRESLGP
jgi:hypothetical protein